MPKSWNELPQNLWEDLSMIVTEEHHDGAEGARDWISRDNVGTCVDFYNSATTDAQKLIVINIFCSDYVTEDTQEISRRFLADVKDTLVHSKGITYEQYTRAIAVSNAEGDLGRAYDYGTNLDALRAAEAKLS